MRWVYPAMISIASILLLGMGVAAMAGEYYVNSKTGDDGNPGTQSSPWKSISNGDRMGLLKPGDTVIVCEGIYDIPDSPLATVDIKKCSGTAEAPVTYRAQGHVVVQGGTILMLIQSNYVNIEGFEVRNGLYGIEYYLGIGGTVKDCVVHDISGRGLAAIFGSDGTFHHNLLYDIGGSEVQSCFYIERQAGTVNILNNTIIANAKHGGMVRGVYTADENTCKVNVLNNIISNCNHGIELMHSGDPVCHSHNILHGNDIDYIATAFGDGEMTASPRLDASYHPAPGSPAVNTGIDTGLPYKGPLPDIGAFETDADYVAAFISGKVISSETGKPVAGARVERIDGPEWVETGADGTYQLIVTTGQYAVRCRIPGYEPAQSVLNLNAGDKYMQVFTLSRRTPVTYYVDIANGSDANDGRSKDAAWKSIDRGDSLGVLGPGDTIVVAAGTYPAGITMGTCAGDVERPLTYKTDGHVTITGGGPYGIRITGDYITLSDFDISECEHGVEITSGASGVVLTGCSIHNLSAAKGRQAAGIFVQPGASCAVTRSMIYDIGNPSDSIDVSSCVYARGHGGLWLLNNTLSRAGRGVFVTGAAVDSEIRNNLILDTGTGLDGLQAGIPHSHNLFHANKRDYGRMFVPGIGDFNADPQLGSGFRPKPGSPAISAGIDAGLPYEGPAPDIGAIETGSVGMHVSLAGAVIGLNGSGVPRAKVTANGGVSCMTDIDGRFLIPLTNGEHTLKVSCPGYKPVTAKVEIGQNKLEPLVLHLMQTKEWTLDEARSIWRPMTHAVQHVGIPGYQFQTGVWWDGSLFFGPQGFRNIEPMLKELEPIGNNALHLTVGYGNTMTYADRYGIGDPHIKRWIEDGRLPIPHVQTRDGDLVWEERVFAHLLDRKPKDGMHPIGDDILVTHARFTVRNGSRESRTGHLWLHFGDMGQITTGYKSTVGTRIAGTIPHRLEIPFGMMNGKVRYVLPDPAKGEIRWHDEISAPEGVEGDPERVIEWDVPLAPGEEAEIRIMLPYGLVDKATAEKILALDEEKAYRETRVFWKELETKAGEIITPDPWVNDYLAAVAGQMSQQVASRYRTGVWMYKTSPNQYEGYWPCNAGKALPAFDLRGLRDIDEPVFQSFIDMQTSDVGGLTREAAGGGAELHGEGYDQNVNGFLGNFRGWTANPLLLSHGLAMWSLASHYRITRDDNWLNSGKVSPLQAMLDAFDWVSTQRRCTMREIDGRRVEYWGLLPAASAHDWLAGNTIFNDAFCIYGMAEIVRMLREIGHPRAEEMAKELNDYRKCLHDRYAEARDRAKPVPLPDGTSLPYVPRMVQELDWQNVDWTYTGYGPLRAGAWGALDPNDDLVNQALLYVEDGMPKGEGFYTALFADLADQNFHETSDRTANRHYHWRHYVEYETMWPIGGTFFLARDDTTRYSEWLFNNLAAVIHPDYKVGVESLDGVASCAPGDGERWQCVRRAFLNEQGGWDGSEQSLWIMQAVPRSWLRPGDHLSVKRMGTFFGGNVDLQADVARDGGSIVVQAELDLRVLPKEIIVRLRSGDGRPLVSAEVNGEPVNVLPGETIRLPRKLTGNYTIIGYFR